MVALYDCRQLLASLREGAHDAVLRSIYAPDGTPDGVRLARDRASHVVEGLLNTWHPGSAPCALFSGPGRTEIGGNHTDHQRGHVLCASVDLDVLACACPNEQNVIRVLSEGFPSLEVSVQDLEPRREETGTSVALVRGVAAKIRAMGYDIAGLDIYAVSSVLSGSGLSSSAAFEVLMGNILNHFFCGGKLDPVQIAKIGQYAENVYFGKPCGLMDQMGASVGGAVAIDFADPDSPAVEPIGYDFSKSGYALCMIDTGSDHAELTEEYAAIPCEMREVAAYFGKAFLREVPERDFRANLLPIRAQCGDRAVLRAMHFYGDDRRAVQEAEALKAGDFLRFLDIVNASGLSSALLLQNIWSGAAPKEQAVSLSLAVGRELLHGTGAIRVHGGGFAGTIQAFVPYDGLERFKTGMESLLGSGKCHILRIRPQGGCVVVA